MNPPRVENLGTLGVLTSKFRSKSGVRYNSAPTPAMFAKNNASLLRPLSSDIGTNLANLWRIPMAKAVTLPALSRAIAELTEDPVPSYRSLWEMVVNNQIRAHQKGRIWMVDPVHAVKDLGLSFKKTVTAA